MLLRWQAIPPQTVELATTLAKKQLQLQYDRSGQSPDIRTNAAGKQTWKRHLFDLGFPKKDSKVFALAQKLSKRIRKIRLIFTESSLFDE